MIAMLERVRGAIKDCPKRFTLHDVCRVLGDESQQTKALVSTALTHLSAPHDVDIAVAGGGRRPAIYERRG